MASSIVSRKGFTIVELMIAVTVFATAMTLILAGVIVISRQFQQASNRVALEEASRDIHQQLLQSIQFSAGAPKEDVNGNYRATCLGNYMYIYGKYIQVDGSSFDTQPEGLYIKDNINGCLQTDITTNGARNLLPPGAKVIDFSVDSDSGTVTTFFIKSGLDLLEIDPLTDEIIGCNTTISGREFCATVKLISSATQRVGS